MEQKQKEELKKLIETAGYNLYDDQMKAKEALDEIAKGVKNTFLVEPAIFKKLVKLHYDKSMENERRKFNEIDELYVDLFGAPEPETDLFSGDDQEKNEQLDKIRYGVK